MKNSYLWIGAVVIVVLIAGYYLLAQTQRKAAPTTTPSQSVQTTPATESAEQIEKNFVEAEDQPAGTTVVTKRSSRNNQVLLPFMLTSMVNLEKLLVIAVYSQLV